MRIFGKDKRGFSGAVSMLTGAVLSLIVLGIIWTLGARIMTDVSTATVGTGNTTASAIANNSLDAMRTTSSNQGLLWIVLVLAAILIIVISVFTSFTGKGR